jgi:hypothetical protein
MTIGGLTAGLVRGVDVQRQLDAKKAAERNQFQTLSADVTGQGAATVYRDKRGLYSCGLSPLCF